MIPGCMVEIVVVEILCGWMGMRDEEKCGQMVSVVIKS